MSKYDDATEYELGEYRQLLNSIHLLGSASSTPAETLRTIAQWTSPSELASVVARSIQKAAGDYGG